MEIYTEILKRNIGKCCVFYLRLPRIFKCFNLFPQISCSCVAHTWLHSYGFTFDFAFLYSYPIRVAGNAAYIFGTLAEHGHGQSRVMGLINGEHPHNILADLTTMLEYDDTESVMNAAGTLGTLVSV